MNSIIIVEYHGTANQLLTLVDPWYDMVINLWSNHGFYYGLQWSSNLDMAVGQRPLYPGMFTAHKQASRAVGLFTYHLLLSKY